jgi:uncharacterized protein (DUF924 family)
VIAPEDILAFWFPPGIDADEAAHQRQFQWWFGGGANAIREKFAPALEAAIHGELNGWAKAARSRLALIIVLDQFSRTIHSGTPRAYAQDEKTIGLAIEGLDLRHYDNLATAWEKTFFFLPLGHSEQLGLHERCVRLAEGVAQEAPARLRRIYEFSAAQARGHRDVIARFGRHPHRNDILGRTSTEEERGYIAEGNFVHRRSFEG